MNVGNNERLTEIDHPHFDFNLVFPAFLLQSHHSVHKCGYHVVVYLVFKIKNLLHQPTQSHVVERVFYLKDQRVAHPVVVVNGGEVGLDWRCHFGD